MAVNVIRLEAVCLQGVLGKVLEDQNISGSTCLWVNLSVGHLSVGQLVSGSICQKSYDRLEWVTRITGLLVKEVRVKTCTWLTQGRHIFS